MLSRINTIISVQSKILLIVAGPTGCGKSTFLSSALGSKPSPLTKEILKNTFTRSDYKIEKLFLKRLKKQNEKQGRFQKFTRRYNNFILDVDTTGARFKDSAIIFPDFLQILIQTFHSDFHALRNMNQSDS